MSGEAIGWAFRKVQMDDPTAKLVLVALCNYANHEDQAWPSHAAVCQVTGLSKRSVQNSIKKLEDWGLIRRVRRSRADGSEASAMVEVDIDHDWVIENGIATRAPSSQKTMHKLREVSQEVREDMATDATLETTLKPQSKKKDSANAAPEDLFPDKNQSNIAPTNPSTELYREGRRILGTTSGGLVKKLLDAKKGNIAQARAVLILAEDTDSPREYIGGVLKNGETKSAKDFYDPAGGYGDTHW